MFDINEFSNILENINSKYDTMTDFAKKANFDRTYISKYINKKLSNPPTPKILKKIADASKGVTTYSELMLICGYIDKIEDNVDTLKNLKTKKMKLEKQYEDLKLNKYEKNAINNFLIDEKKLNQKYHELTKDTNYSDFITTQSWHEKEYTKLYESILNCNSKNIRQNILTKALRILNYIDSINSSIKFHNETIDNTEKYHTQDNNAQTYKRIPVLGSIPAGIPIELIEDILDYEDISEEMLKGDKEYFALKVKGSSMWPKYLDGDTIIVLKQDDCESGQDAIVMVNGDDGTFKRVIKKDNGITLEPINQQEYNSVTYTNEEIIQLPVKILGIVKEIRRKI